VACEDDSKEREKAEQDAKRKAEDDAEAKLRREQEEKVGGEGTAMRHTSQRRPLKASPQEKT
jgi:hypothetical protein